MSNLEKIKNTDRSRTSDYLNRYGLSNYKHFLEIMTPEMFAFLMVENKCTNTCIMCSEMEPYDAPGNKSCDMKCYEHTLEFLNKEYDEKIFNRALNFMQIPKEEE